MYFYIVIDWSILLVWTISINASDGCYKPVWVARSAPPAKVLTLKTIRKHIK